jgi:transcriptional regulator with PAS, ATPase and Fis domain
MKEATEELEKQLISEAINKHKSLRKVAEYLGVNESTISRKVQKYNILF